MIETPGEILRRTIQYVNEERELLEIAGYLWIVDFIEEKEIIAICELYKQTIKNSR